MAKYMNIEFPELSGSDLYVDAIYEGGKEKNIGDEPLHHLFPRCGTSGGFRKVARKDDPSKMAYVILYTSMQELEWPDYLDEETGMFRYYGDNRLPGRELTDTKQGGNKLLENVFKILNSKGPYSNIPPFFVFKNTGKGRDMQFLGLAAPGNTKLSSDRDLVAFWRTMGDKRFQNYESYFTILDTGESAISRHWLEELITDHDNSLKYAPPAWQKFIKKGREGISALTAKRIVKVPNKYEQLQSDEEGKECLKKIHDYYASFPQGFEACATEIMQKMDSNFAYFDLTRPWRDGGRDAIGQYVVHQAGRPNFPLKMDCALEAKCYAPDSSVGVKQMSRLISRIRYRQFGIMITTSYVNKQAYDEVVEDQQPILIVTASDIAAVLRSSSIHADDIEEWLNDISNRDSRIMSYYRGIKDEDKISGLQQRI